EARCPALHLALTLDVDREGRIRVLSERLRRIATLDPRGALQGVLPWSFPGEPISIHCLNDGSVLVGTWKPGGIHRIDREGAHRWSWSPGGSVLAEARAVAAGPDGAYYVADATLHRVIAVAPVGDGATEIVRAFGVAASPGFGPGRFSNPSMLEVDARGEILV